MMLFYARKPVASSAASLQSVRSLKHGTKVRDQSLISDRTAPYVCACSPQKPGMRATHAVAEGPVK